MVELYDRIADFEPDRPPSSRSTSRCSKRTEPGAGRSGGDCRRPLSKSSAAGAGAPPAFVLRLPYRLGTIEQRGPAAGMHQ